MSNSRFSYDEQARFARPFIRTIGIVLNVLEDRDLTIPELRQQLSAQIHRAVDESRRANFPDVAIESAQFAVCAWCDEALMNSGWEGVSEIWPQDMLQKEFFSTNLAGESFFERLEDLQADERLALSVFAFCLANNFKGRYVYDLALTELEAIRTQTITLTLDSVGLDKSAVNTFPSLNALKDSLYLPWKSNYWVIYLVVVGGLFALISSILASSLHEQVALLLPRWK